VPLRKFRSKALLEIVNKNPVFFFDFDGTLAEIVPTPEEAGLKPITKYIVMELTKRFPVGIISGRKLDELRGLVGIKGVLYSGNHGVEIEGPQLKFVEPESAEAAGHVTLLGKKIASRIESYKPRINFKKYSVSIHYRTVDPAKVKALLAELNRMIEEPFRRGEISVMHGKKVVEIKSPSKWNKGDAIEMIMRKVKRRGLPIFFGDDTTDEYGFQKVNELNGVSVFVGRKHRGTAAKYQIESPSRLVGALASFLFALK